MEVFGSMTVRLWRLLVVIVNPFALRPLTR
jgi:hypothetical protein